MSAASGTTPRLLIVEDRNDVRELLVEQFRRHGYDVDVARDGDEVLVMARHTRPDAVLMDLNLPTMDGLEATRRLRGDPETAGIPVVAITAAPSHYGEGAAREAGAVDFVVKPWEPERLEEAVRNAIRRTHQGAKAPSGRLAGVRILAVDDEPDSLGAIVLMLSLGGATVDARESAAEALRDVASLRPDVIVCDLSMPGQDGFELLSRLRAAGVSAPVVALTAHAFSEQRQRALEAGFAGFIVKPVDPGTIVDTLADVLGRG